MSRPRQDPAQATPTPYQGKDGVWHVYVPMGWRPDAASILCLGPRAAQTDEGS